MLTHVLNVLSDLENQFREKTRYFPIEKISRLDYQPLFGQERAAEIEPRKFPPLVLPRNTMMLQRVIVPIGVSVNL